MRSAYTIFSLTLLLAAPACLATPLAVTASLNLSPDETETRMTAANHSDATIEGRGDRLRIAYTSSVRIAIDITPVRRGSGYDPAEVLHATLPAGEGIDAIIDLKATPALSLFHQRYILDFFSNEGGGAAEMRGMEILPWSAPSLLQALKQHILIREKYQVSTFHALRGYSLLGISMATILGILLLLVFLTSLLRFSNQKPETLPRSALFILILCVFPYSAWSGIDLARFTAGNLREWYVQGTYNHAGSAEAVADDMRRESSKYSSALLVYVCDDETDFYAKMLRYFAYPIRVSRRGEDVPLTTHVLVKKRRKWSYAEGVLTCGELSGPAKKLADFPDGSHLFIASQ